MEDTTNDPIGSIDFHGVSYPADALYLLAVEHQQDCDILHVKFGSVSAQNSTIVRVVRNRLTVLINNGELRGGEIIKVNGPASLPVAAVITHAVEPLYEVVATFDPKVSPPYVVVVTQGSGRYQVGDTLN